MFVEGSQTDFSKPIFLSCPKSVVFNNVNANKLQLSSPRIVGTGISVIDCLSLGKLNQEDGDKLQNFTNYGSLNARELFLNNLNGDNQGAISASHVGVHGQVEYAGEIKTDKLVLSESAFFKLTQDSRADIKALFLSKDSHFENHQQDKDKINIVVLNSLESSVTIANQF